MAHNDDVVAVLINAYAQFEDVGIRVDRSSCSDNSQVLDSEYINVPLLVPLIGNYGIIKAMI